MDLLKQISEFLIDGDEEKVSALTDQALEKQVAPKEILDHGLLAGMEVVGENFRKHEIFLPDVLLASKAMYAGLDKIKPLLAKEGIPSLGKIVIGTVHGDLHDIGKNLVSIMLKGAGFDVIDLGKDVPAEKFIEAAKKEEAKVIGMSALLTTTMPVMKKVVHLLREEKLTGQMKTIIGGAPVSMDFAQEIGAHGYGFDAAKAVDLVKELLGKS
jgi:5-methyltetrahydrofolate--homocysteine methyltransferase